MDSQTCPVFVLFIRSPLHGPLDQLWSHEESGPRRGVSHTCHVNTEGRAIIEALSKCPGKSSPRISWGGNTHPRKL